MSAPRRQGRIDGIEVLVVAVGQDHAKLRVVVPGTRHTSRSRLLLSKLYEDLQCPICRQFEQVAGQQVQAAIADGKVKVDYHMVAFLDRSSTTNYSSRALNAAMAVLSTAGPDAFLRFHTLAYQHQPAEGSAGVPDSTLMDWAVQPGADKGKVASLINGNVYHQWVVNATDQMSKDKVTGTPTVFINGKEFTSPSDAATAVLAATK